MGRGRRSPDARRQTSAPAKGASNSLYLCGGQRERLIACSCSPDARNVYFSTEQNVQFSRWITPVRIVILQLRSSADNDVRCPPFHPAGRRASLARRPELVGTTVLDQRMVRAAPRVLVVDDDLPTCELIELALGGEGWDVQTRTCGQDALEVLQQRAVDVVLLDLVMPEMDAGSFLAMCRQQGTRETPVLLVSAAPNLEQHAARLGVSGALAKPFDIDDLCALVRQVVAQGLAVNGTGAAAHGR